MRLISQDGMIDVSYENLTIAVDNDNDDGKVHILARGIVEYLSVIIAVYSNTDKALKVMEMLRNAYCGKVIFQNVTISEDVLKLMKEWKTQAIISKTDSEPRIEYINNNIFVFPKDSEVEV